MAIFIQSAEQISVQQPLSDAWFDAPVMYDTAYVRAMEPNYKEYLDAGKSRRMGKILKRAIVTARTAAKNSGIAMPDAIISGTGLGCIESTEIFLEAMVRHGEELLQPVHFMQSTHNTIGSMVSIDMKCHGYNSTYTHKGVSFENALLDAFMQLSAGRIKTALVNGFDEMTPKYQLCLSRIGYWRAHDENQTLQKDGEAFAGETSVSFMLSSGKNERTICRIAGLTLLYKPDENDLQIALNGLLAQNACSINDIDAVVTGVSGNPENDGAYRRNAPVLFAGKPLVRYKHIFGESYTASGLGMYVAATCLRRQRIPRHLTVNGCKEIDAVKTLLLYNHSEDKNHSLTLLTSC
jgi:3-oxoacyl-(acyl-carrier-protein) synthase